MSETRRSPETVRITEAAKQKQGEYSPVPCLQDVAMVECLDSGSISLTDWAIASRGKKDCTVGLRMFAFFVVLQERYDVPALGCG